MLDPVANGIVLAMFGLLIGAVLQIVARMQGEYALRRTSTFGGSFWQRVRAASEEGRTIAKQAPRSYKIAMGVAYGLFALLALTVYLSPVEMRWAYFLTAVLAGFLVLRGVQALSARPEVQTTIQGWADRLGESREVLNGVHILWVDDYPSGNRFEQAMMRNRGAVVDTAESTDQALQALDASPTYDVIISDMERDGDASAGLQLLEQTKERHIPTIFYIGQVDPSLGTPANAFHITDEPDDLIYAVVRAAAESASHSRS